MSAKGLNTVELKIEDGRGHFQPLDKSIDETVVGTTLARTIEGASTVKVTARDPDKRLQLAGLFNRKAEAVLDDLAFIACASSKKADEYTLTFEDREFHELREDTTPRRAVRSPHMTLARFIRGVCHEVCPHAGFICPELDLIQSVQESKKKKVPKRGVAQGTITIEGLPADADQENNVNILLEVCDEHNAPEIVRVAIICAAIGESTLRTETQPNSLGYWGVLQGGSGQNGSAPNFPNTPNPKVTKEMAESFLLGGRGFQAGGALALARGGNSDPGDIATKVEDSGEPAYYYGKHKAEAEAILKAAGGSASSTTSHTKTKPEPVIFEINGKEELESNTLKGIENYAKKYEWRFFKVGNDFYLIHDEYLVKTKPALVLDERTVGVLDIGWELDHNEKKKASVVTVECRAEMWTPEPGTIIRLAESVGKELSDRNWIVAKIERKDITDPATTVELTRPEKAIAEPVDKLVTVPSEIAKTPANPAGSQQRQQPGEENPGALKGHSLAWKIYEQAKWISAQHYLYLYGGGHGVLVGATSFTRLEETGGEGAEGQELSVGHQGLDCSGAVSWALASAGILTIVGTTLNQKGEGDQFPLTTHGLEQWGEAGPGKFVTVWVRNSGGQEHCFIEFAIPAADRPEGGGDIHEIFEASHPNATVPAPHGVGLRPAYAIPAGFVARHWPGT